MHGKQKDSICPLCADNAATYTFWQAPEKDSDSAELLNIVYIAK